MLTLFKNITINLKCLKPNVVNTVFKNIVKSSSSTVSYIGKSYKNPQEDGQQIIDPLKDKEITKDVIKKVNDTVKENRHGRLFAVVQVSSKQFKVTAGDLIIIQGFWPPTTGDEISLDKILLVGGKEFTLLGRPILNPGIASVKATVIEKTLSHTKTYFRKLKRKQYQRINFFRIHYTMLRINSIDLIGEINNPKSIEGLSGNIF